MGGSNLKKLLENCVGGAVLVLFPALAPSQVIPQFLGKMVKS